MRFTLHWAKDKIGGCFVKNCDETMIIAIDGTSGSGKSTIAGLIAKKLSFEILNTGLLYRGIAKVCLENKINKANVDDIIKLTMDFDFHKEHAGLHSEKVSKLVPFISKIPAVRSEVRRFQQETARNKKIVIEGRDIGTVVFPNADYKIFITASIEERSRRRHQQIQHLENAKMGEIMRNIKDRDFTDAHRTESPLKIPEGAYVLDTTGKTIEDTLKEALDYLKFST